MRVIVTGGAGFVGSNVAVSLAERHPDWEVVAFDNLRRRGSELTLSRLRDHGIAFVHGDIREQADLDEVGDATALVECSAEPSVLAGRERPDYLVRTNLLGAYACLEFCRVRDATLVLLSTSRVYPVGRLGEVAHDVSATRLELSDHQMLPGVSTLGISESFPLDGARTLYGATKLAAELIVAEYVDVFGLRAVVDRCGVIAGPWQMGKVDQGVLAHWLLAHHFGLPLRYIGFGGSGKQVRDFLDVRDLSRLIEMQIVSPNAWQGVVANVGGGRDRSLSLLELTALCRNVTGREVPVEPDLEARPGDVPIYISDCSHLFSLTDWRPEVEILGIVQDTHDWIAANDSALKAALLA